MHNLICHENHVRPLIRPIDGLGRVVRLVGDERSQKLNARLNSHKIVEAQPDRLGDGNRRSFGVCDRSEAKLGRRRTVSTWKVVPPVA